MKHLLDMEMVRGYQKEIHQCLIENLVVGRSPHLLLLWVLDMEMVKGYKSASVSFCVCLSLTCQVTPAAVVLRARHENAKLKFVVLRVSWVTDLGWGGCSTCCCLGC